MPSIPTDSALDNCLVISSWDYCNHFPQYFCLQSILPITPAELPLPSTNYDLLLPHPAPQNTGTHTHTHTHTHTCTQHPPNFLSSDTIRIKSLLFLYENPFLQFIWSLCSLILPYLFLTLCTLFLLPEIPSTHYSGYIPFPFSVSQPKSSFLYKTPINH